MGLTFSDADDKREELRSYTITSELIITKLDPQPGDIIVIRVDTSGLNPDVAYKYMSDIKMEVRKVLGQRGNKIAIVPKDIDIQTIPVIDLMSLLEDRVVDPEETDVHP